MTQVKRSSDCGNSPKNRMVEDIAVALETRDTDFLLKVLDPDSVWNHSDGTVATAETIFEQVGNLDMPAEVAVDRVMSHGKVGAVNGTSGEQRFCHVIEFTSVKCNRVRRIESYCG